MIGLQQDNNDADKLNLEERVKPTVNQQRIYDNINDI